MIKSNIGKTSMWKKLLVLQVISVTFCLQLNASYDKCKHILRDGLRDTRSSSDNVDRQVALHREFCSIAKEKNLNEHNFETFAEDYLKRTKGSSDNYGGNANAGFLGFSFGGGYGQSHGRENMSESEKINFLKDNKKALLDYFQQNCGKENYEESLKTEAAVMSKIANSDIIAAWRDCMVNHSGGFFVDVIPGTTDLSSDQINYAVSANWKSVESTKIISLELTFERGIISGPFRTEVIGDFEKVDLCKERGCPLKSGAHVTQLLHKNRTRSTNVTIVAKTDRNVFKTQIITLPKKTELTPIALAPASSSLDESYWTVEHYCDNSACQNFKKNIRSTKHAVGENFVVDSTELNGGTCEKCGCLKHIRFGFKQCRYVMKGKKSNGSEFQTGEDLAFENIRYYYPQSDWRQIFNKTRILTAKPFESSLDEQY